MNITLEKIIASRIHLGHPTPQWNPKMSIYTYGSQSGVHVIDLIKTRIQLHEAQKFATIVRSQGKDILFVGTKHQAAPIVEEIAVNTQSFFVKERWLGGILTNWSTVRDSLIQLHRLEREQKSGSWECLTKKEAALFQKRLYRLTRYLEGLKGIRALPGAVVIIGQTTESAAVQECVKLGIPIISRLDTDCDPRLTKIGVPINDDSTSRIRLFLETLQPRIQEGRRLWVSKKAHA